jgi:ATP-dependent protease ClpP protease subunit
MKIYSPHRIRASQMHNTVYVNFHSGISEPVVNKLMAACVEVLGQTKPKAFYFLFASGGGEVDAGIVLYNFLRALPCKGYNAQHWRD